MLFAEPRLHRSTHRLASLAFAPLCGERSGR